MMRLIAMLIVSIVLFAAVLTACGGAGESPPPITTMPSASDQNSTAAQPAAADIVISDYAFTVPASVKPGQQVTIVNKDSPAHSVTADANNAFDVRVSGDGGIQTLTAPTTPGTYPFRCKYHANVLGSLVVQ